MADTDASIAYERRVRGVFLAVKPVVAAAATAT
jgi:hypothetical protein